MAPTLVSGVRARSDFITNREDIMYMEGIANLEHWRNPLVFLTQRIAHSVSGTVPFSWFEDEDEPIVDQIFDSTDSSDSATVITVVQGELWTTGSLWEDMQSGEVVLVQSRSGDDITIERDYGPSESYTAADTISDDDYWRKLSSAYTQAHLLPEITTTKPIEVSNRLQDHRTPFGMTEIARAAKLRGDSREWDRLVAKAGAKHTREIEMALWFGKKATGTGSRSTTTTTTGADACDGVNARLVDKNDSDLLKDQDDITMFDFMDYIEVVMQKGGKQSSRTKWCFCPSTLRTGLDKWGITKLNTFVETTVFGMAIDRWKTSNGHVNFVTHDLMQRPAGTSAAETALYRHAFFLDLENDKIQFVTHQDIGTTRRRDLETYKATGSTEDNMEFQTIFSTVVKLPLCHGRLRFKSVSV